MPTSMNHLSSKKLLWLIIALTFIVACASDPTESETVSFMVFGDPAERNAYQELVSAYLDVYPEADIELIHIPSPRDYRTRLATEYAAGTAPDITLMNYRRYASFAAKDLLEPLGPLLQGSPVISTEDFYPATIEAFTWRDQLMCLPQNISSLVVYYNADLFDKAGIPHPADRWTWADFIQTADELTLDRDEDGRIDQYGLGADPSLFRLAPFVWQNMGPIVDSDERPTHLTLNRPPSLEALQYFVDLRQVHEVVPNRLEEASQDSESRFIAGTTAMFLNSRRGTTTYREIDSFNWDVAPLPTGKASSGILHSDAYCLSKNTANKDEAWQFIEFANSPQGQSIIAGSGRTVPSLIAVAESDAFLDPNQPPSRAYVFLENAAIVRRVPVISTWQEIEDIASEEIERAFYGDITVAEAARLAVLRTEEYFLLGNTAATP